MTEIQQSRAVDLARNVFVEARKGDYGASLVALCEAAIMMADASLAGHPVDMVDEAAAKAAAVILRYRERSK